MKALALLLAAAPVPAPSPPPAPIILPTKPMVLCWVRKNPPFVVQCIDSRYPKSLSTRS